MRKLVAVAAYRAGSYQIELPARVSYMLACEGQGPETTCAALPARANIGTLCNSPNDCAKVETIMSSIRFAFKPYSPYPDVEPQWQPPETVCRAE